MLSIDNCSYAHIYVGCTCSGYMWSETCHSKHVAVLIEIVKSPFERKILRQRESEKYRNKMVHVTVMN